MRVRRLLLILGIAALAGTAAPAMSEGGSGPLRIVIAFPPGGPVDFVARILGEGLSKELGQTVIVDNRPGANGGSARRPSPRQPPTATRSGSRARGRR